MVAHRLPSPDELRVLLSFLADPSPDTVRLARAQLSELLAAYPDLRGHLPVVAGQEHENAAKAFLEEMRLEDLFQEWSHFLGMGGDLDLEVGCGLLARLAYPDFSLTPIRAALDDMAAAVERMIRSGDLSPRETQACLGRYLFQELGFHGNQDHYDDLDNNFINKVIERRTGLPITLSAIYLLVGWRLSLPVYGVGLPGHFVAAHVIEGRPIYIDAFYRGRLLTSADCAQIVRRRGIEFQERFLSPMSRAQILARMIVNVMTLYTEQGDSTRASWLSRVLSLMQESE